MAWETTDWKFEACLYYLYIQENSLPKLPQISKGSCLWVHASGRILAMLKSLGYMLVPNSPDQILVQLRALSHVTQTHITASHNHCVQPNKEYRILTHMMVVRLGTLKDRHRWKGVHLRVK